MDQTAPPPVMSHGQLLELKRWNTPTIYNGWEQITRRDRTKVGFNLEETRDFMPQMGVMVGYAVTLVIEPGNPEHPKNNPNAWAEYRRYVASQSGPKIVVVQDLDKPRTIGSFWGEVNANTHRALGCVGTITDGAIRDVSEMTNAGFKAIARRLSVGHAWSCPVRWGCEVEVFGQKVLPGMLVHADQHGFMAMTPDEQEKILDAARFMDSNECSTVIPAARNSAGKTTEELLAQIDAASKAFKGAARKRFHGETEFKLT